MLSKSVIKYIQSLSQKKLREEHNAFIGEGPKIINELLNASNIELKELFATERWLKENGARWGDGYAKRMVAVTDAELDRISQLSTPHEVLGVFSKPVFANPIKLAGAVTLMLDALQDPGNLGTIVRCADWFGIDQVVCSGDCADVFNAKVVQSTMGSICRVQVDYADLADMLVNSPVPVYAASLNGIDLRKFDKIKEGVIIIGNESKGIEPVILKMAQHHITIWRHGSAESLNAAVATGIILFHLT